LLGRSFRSTVVAVPVVAVPVVPPCVCVERLGDLLAGWSEVLTRRLSGGEMVRDAPSVLVHAGCSPSCGVQALLRLRLAGSGPLRWTFRSSPAALTPGIVGSDVLLRTASTVYLTTSPLSVPSLPVSFRAPQVRRVYFPPLGMWRSFLADMPADGVPDPLPAAEVFSVLVEDGMPVRDALGTAANLSR